MSLVSIFNDSPSDLLFKCKMPDNIVSYRRNIFLTRYFKQNITGYVEIDVNGKPISNFPGKIDILLSNYSVTTQKNPDQHYDEIMVASFLYFGTIYASDQNIRYNGLKNLRNSDILEVYDYFYNIFFDRNDYKKNTFMENYTRSSKLPYDGFYRNLANKAVELKTPLPRYYTYEHQLLNDNSGYTMSDYVIDICKGNKTMQPLNVGELKNIIDDNTKLIELNIKLNPIADMIFSSDEKANFLDSLTFLLALLKYDLEVNGYCKGTIIMDSKTGFNVKDLYAYIDFDPKVQKTCLVSLYEVLSCRYNDNFLSEMIQLGIDMVLYIYMDQYQTNVEILAREFHKANTDFIQKEIIEDSMFSD